MDIEVVDFDPYLPPKKCSVDNCKNHLLGNSGYRRCPLHRREFRRDYTSSYHKKRKIAKQVYDKALEEGRDPEEALKDFMLKNNMEDDSEDEEGDKSTKKPVGKKRAKSVLDPALLDSPFTTSASPVEKRPPLPPPSKRKVGDICGAMGCSNLLHPTVGVFSNCCFISIHVLFYEVRLEKL